MKTQGQIEAATICTGTSNPFVEIWRQLTVGKGGRFFGKAEIWQGCSIALHRDGTR
jgi:hypothetical protein